MCQDKIKIAVIRASHACDDLPEYATQWSSGMDLRSSVDITLHSMERFSVPTGLSIALPFSIEAQIRPRSGLAYKHGITVLNSPGTIDSDYRGELKVLLINFSTDSYHIQRGDRIAQLVFSPIFRVQWEEVVSLPESNRNIGGFGSTGYY